MTWSFYPIALKSEFIFRSAKLKSIEWKIHFLGQALNSSSICVPNSVWGVYYQSYENLKDQLLHARMIDKAKLQSLPETSS